MIRVGQGFDAHAFDPERRLVLGGVTIPDAPGLGGHSDADVLSHAVADALLGAAGFGDLGSHFPGTERWKDASSLEILAECISLLAAEGWAVLNVDATVVAERPKLGPFTKDMASNIAEVLGGDAAVNVKATSTDAMGATGRGEGMAALAVALIQRS
jgi:2-C-methyl-D-erythritol 2,4-cyclodiphosphate synthase